ncbi:MAG: hypothetical protein IJ934_01025 [Acetobacter sp.]|nr:hypothetical protein [Acetobacter sp.]
MQDQAANPAFSSKQESESLNNAINNDYRPSTVPNAEEDPITRVDRALQRIASVFHRSIDQKQQSSSTPPSAVTQAITQQEILKTINTTQQELLTNVNTLLLDMQSVLSVLTLPESSPRKTTSRKNTSNSSQKEEE